VELREQLMRLSHRDHDALQRTIFELQALVEKHVERILGQTATATGAAAALRNSRAAGER
jgi:hypothetical protein